VLSIAPMVDKNFKVWLYSFCISNLTFQQQETNFSNSILISHLKNTPFSCSISRMYMVIFHFLILQNMVLEVRTTITKHMREGGSFESFSHFQLTFFLCHICIVTFLSHFLQFQYFMQGLILVTRWQNWISKSWF